MQQGFIEVFAGYFFFLLQKSFNGFGFINGHVFGPKGHSSKKTKQREKSNKNDVAIHLVDGVIVGPSDWSVAEPLEGKFWLSQSLP